MGCYRRNLGIAGIAGSAGIAALGVFGAPAVVWAQASAQASQPAPTASAPGSMYGLIGKMIAAPGQRDALIAILLDSTGGMPGCLSYVIAKDAKNADAIWITEVWDSEQSHKASLSLPAVRQAIGKAKPLIAGFGDYSVITPVGGHGLATQAQKDSK